MQQVVQNLDYQHVKIYNMENVGYHLSPIPKGILGEFSKIEEEFLEAKDAIKQDIQYFVFL
jgi:hypothetical protein